MTILRFFSPVLRNVFATGLTRAVTVIHALIVLVLVSRYFGPALSGYYVSLYALLTLIDTTVESSLLLITVREISQETRSADRYLLSATTIRLGVALIGTAVFPLFAQIAGYPAEVKQASYVASLILLVNAFRMPMALFRAQLLMHYEFFINLVARVVEIALILSLIFYQGSFLSFFMARLIGASLYVLLSWGLAHSFLHFRILVSGETVKYLILQCLPIALSNLLVMIQLKVDILLVSFHSGPVSGGLYGAIAQFPEYSMVIPDLLITTAFPLLVRFHAKSAHLDFQHVCQKAFDLLMAFIIPMAVVTTLIPDSIVLVLFGSRFLPIAPVLRILIWVIVLMYFAVVMGASAIAVHRQKSLIWIEMINVVVYLTLDFLLIPYYNYFGAALGRLFAAMIGPALTYRVVQHETGLHLRCTVLLKVALSSIATGAVILLVSPFHLALALGAGLIMYIGAFWSLGGMKELKKGVAFLTDKEF